MKMPDFKVMLADPVARKKLLLAGISLGAVLLGASVGVGTYAVLKGKATPISGTPVLDAEGNLSKTESYLQKGLTFMDVGFSAEAMACFRAGLDAAVEPEERARCGLYMGRLLNKKALDEPRPNVIMARQYLSAAADLAQTDETRQKVQLALLENIKVTSDQLGWEDETHKLIAMTTNEADKADLYQTLLDDAFDRGTYPKVAAVVREAKVALSSDLWEERFGKTLRDSDERAIRDELWFSGYLAEFPGRQNDQIRHEVIDRTLAWYDKARKDGTIDQDTLLYKRAWLLFEEGDFKQCRENLKKFFALDSSKYAEETYLLLARLAFEEGDLRAAHDALLIFIRRYKVMHEAEKLVNHLLDLYEEQHRLPEALELARKVATFSRGEDASSRLILRALGLATRLGREEDMELLFERFLESNPSPDLLDEGIMSQVNLRMAKGDFDGAEKLMVIYFSRLPVDAAHPDGVFKVFQIRDLQHAPLTDLVASGALALRVAPKDPRAVDTIVKMGTRLETAGLWDMAEAQYDRIGILRLDATSGPVSNATTEAGGWAALGKARCLLNRGETVQANNLMREICRTFPVGPVRSQTAFNWALIAIRTNQREEAKRRLLMAESRYLPPELADRSELERRIIEIQTGMPEGEEMSRTDERLTRLPDAERAAYLVRLYSARFGQEERRKNVEGMKEFLEKAVAGPHANMLPLRSYAVRLVDVIREKEGINPFLQAVDSYVNNPKYSGSAEPIENEQLMTDVSKKIEELRPIVANFE